MLSRPEVGTKEHIHSWLTTKDESEIYEWLSDECPAGQYAKEFGEERTELNLNWLNSLALPQPHTWGALAERAK